MGGKAKDRQPSLLSLTDLRGVHVSISSWKYNVSLISSRVINSARETWPTGIADQASSCCAQLVLTVQCIAGEKWMAAAFDLRCTRHISAVRYGFKPTTLTKPHAFGIV